MIHPSKSFPFDDSHLEQINTALRLVQEAKAIALRGQKAGLPTDQAMADAEFLIQHLEGIKQEFFTPKVGD